MATLYSPAYKHELGQELLSNFDHWFDELRTRADQPWAWNMDRGKAKAHMEAAHLHGRSTILADHYYFMWDKGSMWHSTQVLLIEQAMFAMRPGSLADAIEGMNQLAVDLGCHQIAIGSSLAKNDAAFTRLFQRHGFTVQCHRLTKDIHV